MPFSYAAVRPTRPTRPVGPVVTSVSLIAVISRNLPFGRVEVGHVVDEALLAHDLLEARRRVLVDLADRALPCADLDEDLLGGRPKVRRVVAAQLEADDHRDPREHEQEADDRRCARAAGRAASARRAAARESTRRPSSGLRRACRRPRRRAGPSSSGRRASLTPSPTISTPVAELLDARADRALTSRDPRLRDGGCGPTRWRRPSRRGRSRCRLRSSAAPPRGSPGSSRHVDRARLRAGDTPRRAAASVVGSSPGHATRVCPRRTARPGSRRPRGDTSAVERTSSIGLIAVRSAARAASAACAGASPLHRVLDRRRSRIGRSATAPSATRADVTTPPSSSIAAAPITFEIDCARRVPTLRQVVRVAVAGAGSVRRDDQLVGREQRLAIAGAELAVRRRGAWPRTLASSSSASSASSTGRLSPTGDDVADVAAERAARLDLQRADLAGRERERRPAARGSPGGARPRSHVVPAPIVDRAASIARDAAEPGEPPQIEDAGGHRPMVRVDHQIGAAGEHHPVGMRRARRRAPRRASRGRSVRRSSARPRLRRRDHRVDDQLIAGAAADVAGEQLAHRRARRRLVLAVERARDRRRAPRTPRCPACRCRTARRRTRRARAAPRGARRRARAPRRW